MSYSVILPSKRSDATVPVTFEFADQLEFGEAITDVGASVEVFSGTDPIPNAILADLPTISGTKVTQVITAGVVGVIYQITVVIGTDQDHIYTKDGKLAIVNSPNAFTGP
jgi:hypothetical protein